LNVTPLHENIECGVYDCDSFFVVNTMMFTKLLGSLGDNKSNLASLTERQLGQQPFSKLPVRNFSQNIRLRIDTFRVSAQSNVTTKGANCVFHLARSFAAQPTCPRCLIR
jgi:hypothetical protein